MLPYHAPAPDPAATPDDQIRHDLKTPLTVISAHAQLLRRRILRAAPLGALEREAMLGDLASIEAAVQALVTRLDGALGSRAREEDGG
ncbi:MAG: histidine kinase dimerization/phospho-acceptor domain-containing protein [Thermomicrobiales bacterium]